MAISSLGQKGVSPLPHKSADGRSSIQKLISDLRTWNDPNVQRSAVSTLMNMGPEARKTIPTLMVILQFSNNLALQGYARQAVNKIGLPIPQKIPSCGIK